MARKRPSTASNQGEAPPPRRRTCATRLGKLREKQATLAQIRSTACIMDTLYSFLSVVDRSRLGAVDKTFRDDPNRGKVVGVYGDDKLNLLEAFRIVKRWKDFDDAPRENEFSPGEYVTRIRGLEVHPSLFSLEKGYDLHRVKANLEARFPFPSEKEWVKSTMDMFEDLNESLEDMRRLEVQVKKLGKDAPYNALYDLLEEHYLNYLGRAFMNARQPGLYESGGEDILEITETDSNGNVISEYLDHLRPGDKFVVPGQKDIFLNRCSKCKLIKEGVQDDYCAFKWCGGAPGRCRDCAYIRTCSTCGKTGCACRFTRCSAKGCKNRMCNCEDFDGYKPDDSGPAPGCSFVEAYDPEEDDEPKKKYCLEHKPEGAIPFEGFGL